MWLQFTRALNKAPSAVHAGLVNSGANFVGTVSVERFGRPDPIQVGLTTAHSHSQALMSRIVFSDPLPPLWWGGSTLILLGMVLMQSGGAKKVADAGKKKKEL